MLSDQEVEVLAEAAHARYLSYVAAGSPAAVPWSGVGERDREANRDSIRFAPTVLAALGLTLVRSGAVAPTPVVLTDEEVEAGARLEHLRWERFTRRSGRHSHADLRPWSALDEETRERDRVRVRDLPTLLPLVGLTVVRPAAAS